MTELSIDTASEMASVALSREGILAAEITWRCRANHTVELLPTVDRLLAQAGVERASLSAVFVTTGPGMYTGLRVGVAVAKGLARALGTPLIGVGRLEIDAYQHATYPGTVVAVHRAGRGEFAWASYAACPWREVEPPQLSRPGEMAQRIAGPALVVGEVDARLREALAALPGVSLAPAAISVRRAGTLAHLGYRRLEEGALSEPALLRPVYLRPPAIGPQASV